MLYTFIFKYIYYKIIKNIHSDKFDYEIWYLFIWYFFIYEDHLKYLDSYFRKEINKKIYIKI